MRILILLIGFVMVWSTSLFAIEFPAQEHAFDAELEAYNFDYKQPDTDVRYNGIMYGLAGAYTYHKDPYNRDNLMIKIEARWTWGQVDYENNIVEVKNINDSSGELRVMAGKDFVFSDVTTITPYAGVGYRYLYDDLGKDDFGFDRESNYWYSPIGIQTVTDLGNEWTAGLKAEYDIFWSGIQKSYLSDIDGWDFDDIENTQTKGYGLRGSIEFQKIGKAIDFIIEPFIRYWHIEESSEEDVENGGVVVGEYQEPTNDTTEAGVKLMIRF